MRYRLVRTNYNVISLCASKCSSEVEVINRNLLGSSPCLWTSAYVLWNTCRLAKSKSWKVLTGHSSLYYCHCLCLFLYYRMPAQSKYAKLQTHCFFPFSLKNVEKLDTVPNHPSNAWGGRDCQCKIAFYEKVLPQQYNIEDINCCVQFLYAVPNTIYARNKAPFNGVWHKCTEGTLFFLCSSRYIWKQLPAIWCLFWHAQNVVLSCCCQHQPGQNILVRDARRCFSKARFASFLDWFQAFFLTEFPPDPTYLSKTVIIFKGLVGCHISRNCSQICPLPIV